MSTETQTQYFTPERFPVGTPVVSRNSHSGRVNRGRVFKVTPEGVGLEWQSVAPNGKPYTLEEFHEWRDLNARQRNEGFFPFEAAPRDRNATPTPFDPARAEEIWSQRGLEHAIEHAMTDGEIAYVGLVWDRMAGHTCFMDAFHRIRRGDLP